MFDAFHGSMGEVSDVQTYFNFEKFLYINYVLALTIICIVDIFLRATLMVEQNGNCLRVPPRFF